MSQDDDALLGLRVENRIDSVVRHRDLRGRVALFVAAAGIAMGALTSTGSWLAALAVPLGGYFLWKMTRAQAELRKLEEWEDE